jgi:F-type H+-transporting ATPase subunit delta
MRPSTTARRYAEAAFDVATADGQPDQWLTDLQTAVEAYNRDSVRNYFNDPKTAREDKLAMLPRIFPALTPRTLNLLRILALKHRMQLLPSIAAEFEHRVRESRGVLEATVTVARPLTADEQEQIRLRLRSLTGNEVEMQTTIDPNVLGGVVVRIGDQVIDASVAGRLERLRQELAV